MPPGILILERGFTSTNGRAGITTGVESPQPFILFTMKSRFPVPENSIVIRVVLKDMKDLGDGAFLKGTEDRGTLPFRTLPRPGKRIAFNRSPYIPRVRPRCPSGDTFRAHDSFSNGKTGIFAKIPI
jgi:hypothetical protein